MFHWIYITPAMNPFFVAYKQWLKCIIWKGPYVVMNPVSPNSAERFSIF